MNSDITTADQLKEIIATEHDRFKATWDKKGTVVYKNERIAILKAENGKVVQFLVAFDQVTKEGYRLMGSGVGLDAQSTGLAGLGGTSNITYLYFQKMK
jgi:hypothetical protein